MAERLTGYYVTEKESYVVIYIDNLAEPSL